MPSPSDVVFPPNWKWKLPLSHFEHLMPLNRQAKEKSKCFLGSKSLAIKGKEVVTTQSGQEGLGKDLTVGSNDPISRPHPVITVTARLPRLYTRGSRRAGISQE